MFQLKYFIVKLSSFDGAAAFLLCFFILHYLCGVPFPQKQFCYSVDDESFSRLCPQHGVSGLNIHVLKEVFRSVADSQKS